MEIKANEISSLIKKEIQDFNKSTEYSKNLGTVVEVGDGIAIIYGLQDVRCLWNGNEPRRRFIKCSFTW